MSVRSIGLYQLAPSTATQPKQRGQDRGRLAAEAAGRVEDYDDGIATIEGLTADLALQASLRVADCEPSVPHTEGGNQIYLAIY